MTFPGPSGERRRAPRFALRLGASLRERGGTIRIPVRVIDISPYGCRIEHSGAQSLQSMVWLYLDKLDGLYARVAWHRDIFAGLEFETPLHEAVIDTLIGADRESTEPTAAELQIIAEQSYNCAKRAGVAPVSKELRALAQDCAISALDRLTRR